MGKRIIVTNGDWTTSHELGDSAIVIGRDPNCDLFFVNQKLSRRHARIEPGPDGVRLVDLGSRNGMWVNEEKVGERLLRPGDAIRLGGLEIAFEEDGVPADPEPEIPEGEEPTIILPAPQTDKTVALRPGQPANAVVYAPSEDRADATVVLAGGEPDADETIMLAPNSQDSADGGNGPQTVVLAKEPADPEEGSGTIVLAKAAADSEEDSGTVVLAGEPADPEEGSGTIVLAKAAADSEEDSGTVVLAGEPADPEEGSGTVVLAKAAADSEEDSGTVVLAREPADPEEGSAATVVLSKEPAESEESSATVVLSAGEKAHAVEGEVDETRNFAEEAATSARVAEDAVLVPEREPFASVVKRRTAQLTQVVKSRQAAAAFMSRSAERFALLPWQTKFILVLSGVGLIVTFILASIALRTNSALVAVFTGLPLIVGWAYTSVVLARHLTVRRVDELARVVKSFGRGEKPVLPSPKDYPEMEKLSQAIDRLVGLARSSGVSTDSGVSESEDSDSDSDSEQTLVR